jgi:hypothetical protein
LLSDLKYKNKELIMTSMCFYFPYLEDSGVPVLFYRMINSIAEANPNSELYAIDYENGAIARHILSLPNIKLIIFNKKVKVSPPKGSILIMQTFVPYYWPEELELAPDQKLFFWNLHAQNLIPSLLPISFLREWPMNNFAVYKFLSFFYNKLFHNLRAYIHLLLETDSLYFMDKPNLDYTAKYLFINIDEKQFLPVPAVSTEIKLRTNSNLLNENTVHIGWVGRLCDFKSHILIYTVNKLVEISDRFDNKSFIYHIVGDGPYLDYVKKSIKSNSRVSVIFHGSISHDKLDDFINNNFDIMTAMGTSALEGAKLHKPTVVLDCSFEKIKKDYLFRELCDTKGFDLGHLISKEDYALGNDSLFDILSSFISDYSLYSNKSEEYFKLNHSIENVRNLLIEKAVNSKLVFSMIDSSIIEKSFLLKLYNRIRKLKT